MAETLSLEFNVEKSRIVIGKIYTVCPQKKHVTTFSTITLTISVRLQ